MIQAVKPLALFTILFAYMILHLLLAVRIQSCRNQEIAITFYDTCIYACIACLRRDRCQSIQVVVVGGGEGPALGWLMGLLVLIWKIAYNIYTSGHRKRISSHTSHSFYPISHLTPLYLIYPDIPDLSLHSRWHWRHSLLR